MKAWFRFGLSITIKTRNWALGQKIMLRALMWLNLFGRLAPPIWCKSAFFVCFRPYVVWQPDDQIGWALASRTKDQFLKFLRNNMYWELVVLKNSIFLSRPFWFSLFIPMKIIHKLCGRMDGTPFLWLWWFTAKNNPPQTLI